MFGSTGSDNFSSAVSAFRSEINNIIGSLDKIKIMLNYKYGVTIIDELFCRISISRETSALCRPVVGSSRI